MKVYMNGYPNHWLSPYTVIDHVFFWTAWSRCHRDRGSVEDCNFVDRPAWVKPLVAAVTPICKALQKVCQIINPEIRLVKIDRYDTWSMDHTLAHIIHPMLVQLQATKHGAPFTDDEDVPDRLKSTSAPARENEWDTDANHFARWDWIMDEMIWSFTQELKDDDEGQFFDYSESRDVEDDWNEKLNKIKIDYEGLEAHQKRKANGFRLFGKYYSSLWD